MNTVELKTLHFLTPVIVKFPKYDACTLAICANPVATYSSPGGKKKEKRKKERKRKKEKERKKSSILIWVHELNVFENGRGPQA